MLPGISCLDTLFADLNIDPLASGLQAYEATNFLTRRRVFDPRAGLLLLQVGMLGQIEYKNEYSRAAIPLLVKVLAPHYSESHIVTLYEAAIHSLFDPVIQQIELSRLPSADIKTSTTLYVPPLPPEDDVQMAERIAAALRSDS
jgi:hypothetical protein